MGAYFWCKSPGCAGRDGYGWYWYLHKNAKITTIFELVDKPYLTYLHNISHWQLRILAPLKKLSLGVVPSPPPPSLPPRHCHWDWHGHIPFFINTTKSALRISPSNNLQPEVNIRGNVFSRKQNIKRRQWMWSRLGKQPEISETPSRLTNTNPKENRNLDNPWCWVFAYEFIRRVVNFCFQFVLIAFPCEMSTTLTQY